MARPRSPHGKLRRLSRKGGSRKATPTATASPTVRDLLWAAGFLEGEGSFIPTRHCAGHMVSACQKDPECLKRLSALFGGRVINPPSRPVQVWQIYGARARGVMLTLLPFMSTRRKAQITEALAAW